MAALPELLTIGELAARSGVAASALRYYESLGLIASDRTGYQRRFHRSELRRVSVIKAAQKLGLSLEEIADAFVALPGGRTPTPADWEAMSATWRDSLDERIAALTRLRDNLSSCIGCGCLSLERCALFNEEDAAGDAGSGARYLIDGEPSVS